VKLRVRAYSNLCRIYFSVFGSGMGHVTRVHDIAEKLYREGDRFYYSSFEEGLDYLESLGEKDVFKSPSAEVFEWSESGGFSARGTFFGFFSAIPSFFKQIYFEMENLSKVNPNVVVSESRLSAIIAARLKSYPVITLLNQFKVLFPPRFQGGVLSNLYQRIEGDVLGLLWSTSDRILMPDLPPPYTIGEANISGNDLTGKIDFIGFMPPPRPTEEMVRKAKDSLGLDGKPLVFIQVSGPGPTKERFLKEVLNSTYTISRSCNIVVSMGYPNGSTEGRRLAGGALVYEWCPVKDELFSLSSIVVGRSGHRTIEQCIDNGKPAVLVPVHNHSEQICNAEKFVKLGLGIEFRAEKMTSKKFADSIEECLSESKYRDNAAKLQSISHKYNGMERAVEIVKSYL
jgi:UDP-N-acetylglucosamine--N-acetylmuramyl-(pentapeptide) pyrophosphoryl-undecaprenol N-acetylglucosamine transferase